MTSPNLRIVIPALAIFLILSLIAARRVPGRWRQGLRIAQMAAGVYLLICLFAYLIPTYGLVVYDQFRPIPPSETRALFQGIEYTRDVRSDPRPTIIHIVRIDLDAPGIGFVVTPPDTLAGWSCAPARSRSFCKLRARNLPSMATILNRGGITA